jgi:hypothetical protein
MIFDGATGMTISSSRSDRVSPVRLIAIQNGSVKTCTVSPTTSPWKYSSLIRKRPNVRICRSVNKRGAMSSRASGKYREVLRFAQDDTAGVGCALLFLHHADEVSHVFIFRNREDAAVISSEPKRSRRSAVKIHGPRNSEIVSKRTICQHRASLRQRQRA